MHEIAGLGVGITRALLAIPGAIKDLRTITAKSPKQAELVRLPLETLQDSLIQFCGAHSWLREAKELHDRLTTLDSMYEGAFREGTKAVALGPFNPEAFSVPEARKSWNAARSYGLLKLLSFSERIAHICPVPLQVDGHESFVSGPVWAKRMIELRGEIDTQFKKYDEGDRNAKYLLADRLDAFGSIVKAELLRANEAIRDEATKLADQLNQLLGALREEN